MFGVGPLGDWVLGQSPADVVVFYDDTEVICVHVEGRTMTPSNENRVMIVPSEPRTMEALREERDALVDVKKDTTDAPMVVGYEERAMRVGPRKRVC